MSHEVRHVSEEEARENMEASREKDWKGKSIVKEIFLGSLRIDWMTPWPNTAPSAEFEAWYVKLRTFMETKVNPTEIDATGEYPPEVLAGLAELGAFGMKIKKEYGGLGFTIAEYCQALELISYYDGNLVALLSAHQSIGVPNPLATFGTSEQKQRFLPRCAKGAISAFALTEPDVGSDPGRLATKIHRNESGDYVLDGVKLWCTNGTIAELFVVMGRHTDTGKVSAVIVEASTPGVIIENRCHFMGLKALANAVIRFDNVVVPKSNLIGKEGDGLKIAFVTLNTGRLSLPAACAASSRNALGMARTFSADRVQWGAPVGKHEAISHKLADMAATTYAIEALSHLANELAMRDGYDIRLEASAAKEYCTVENWYLLDDALQVRGGRGYETELSLAARGERPMGIERALRDSRINRVFEGSSEVMHLFMAREALDKHLKVAWDVINPKSDFGTKLKALPSMLAFYATWYPKLWIGLGTFFRYGEYGTLARHLRFAERSTRKLARNVFHGMAWYGPKLEKKQAFLFRAVDIAMEVLVISAVVARATADAKAGNAQALVIADVHCNNARARIDRHFRDMWRNNDAAKTKLGHAIVDGEHTWIEQDAPIYTVMPADAAAQAAK